MGIRTIKVVGPVGSGKSTLAKKLSLHLGAKFIPEVEDNDLKFFRLLNKRNRTQTSHDKLEFQYYTFEQAYARQFNQNRAVIDVPVEQHFLMAECSLNNQDFLEYKQYYEGYLNKLSKEPSITLVLSLPFEETLRRIASRGRKEEKLSEEEVLFYRNFYNKLYSTYKKDNPDVLFIDDSKTEEQVFIEALEELAKLGVVR